MMLLCAVCLLSWGCSARTQYVLPPLAEKAVPDINPEPRPVPPRFTEAEYLALPLSVKGKILKNQVDWRGYAEIMEMKINILRNYIQTLFTPQKLK